MILLRANPELKQTFERLIKTMGVPVAWEDTFVVLNNFLILPGEVRSLVFNFDNRKAITNIIEIPMAQETIEEAGENVLVTNALEMILYAFGKWGNIKGLKVEKDYAQLNALFSQILQEIKIEPGFRNDGFRFYKEGVQLTYEDVIQAAVEAGKKEAPEEAEEPEEEKLGLWHNVRWELRTCGFTKEMMLGEEKTKSRIGNNFYMVGYKCPDCGEKLFMVVYPVDQEFPVETEEGKVYLARAYACDTCNRFFTPRPGKLLGEGDIYTLNFEDDRNAYEDYQELIGSRGDKTTNYKFNEYEWERSQKKDAGKAEKQEELEQIDEMTEEELEQLEEKMEAGFYSPDHHPLVYQRAKERLRQRRKAERLGKKNTGPVSEAPAAGKSPKTSGTKETGQKQEREKKRTLESEKYQESQKKAAQETAGECGAADRTEVLGEKEKQAGEEGAAETAVRRKYDARMKVAERMSERQLKEWKTQIQKEKLLSESEKKEYIDQLEHEIRKKQEKDLKQKAESCQNKNYTQLSRIIEEMEKSPCAKAVKEPLLQPLYELRQRRAQEEAEALIANMPRNLDRKHFQLFQEKLAQYKEADITPYEETLKKQMEQAEIQEITSLVNRTSKNDRNGLFRLWEKLKGPDYSRENTEKVLEQLHDRIQKLDEAAIDKICPDIMGMTFAEGLEAYDKIAGGMFLPELKSNTLEMIDKRLTKVKADESELLVKKLKGELEARVKDRSSLYFYEARKAMRGEWEGTEAELVESALVTYGSDRNLYEFPVMVCDSTRKGTGREGFLLTPDHLFYNSTFSSEQIPVMDIKNITYHTGLLNKGIYVNQRNGGKTRIPNGVSTRDWEGFAKVLDEFVQYLQEKPESRNISYLAKEEHEIKCCYRCGYTYQGGNVCPKCGSKANK